MNKKINKSSFFAGTLFLFFTLNVFCSFFILSMKTFTIFQLIEKAHWVLLLLSAFAVFSLCYSTESTKQCISDCATLLNSYVEHDALNINHKIEVCTLFICEFYSSMNHFQPFDVICTRLKSSLQRSSFKTSRLYSPVDISISTWKRFIHSCTLQLRIWWFCCNSSLNKVKCQFSIWVVKHLRAYAGLLQKLKQV